jgi:putative CocE/NonD family hydrolase
MDIRARTHQGRLSALPFPDTPALVPPTPDFFAVLKGAPTDQPSRISYYVMGDARQTGAAGNTVRTADRWPPAAKPMRLFFHAGGALSVTPPTCAGVSRDYDYDPRDPAPSLGGGFSYGTAPALSSEPLDQRPLSKRRDLLRFVSAPLAAPVEVVGKVQADLYVSSTAADTLFVVKLMDVYPDGYEALLREGAFMGRYRNGFDRPSALETGGVHRLTFPLNSTAVVFARGHRIGVYVTSSSTPAYEVHPNTYEQVHSYDHSPTARQRIWVSAVQPSGIILPWVAGTPPVD